eukprot:TRINITY_DN29439_c0_g1_i3.p3 TRINITY_DN29439_c0_g1~~TRINITY_DN29439_c0_g1_i3.p3  ORF type:complete len:141 (+),score=37.57 TRINITY_DN29439_c0_g1_i3:195-617(+)
MLVGRIVSSSRLPALARGLCSITRINTDDVRMSQIVKHAGTVYIAGQVGEIDLLEKSDITAQTEQCLAKVDALLAKAGTDKSKLLTGQIWLRDIDNHFVAMNEVWNAWIDEDNKPTRVCTSANMARKSILVEVQVVAAEP